MSQSFGIGFFVFAAFASSALLMSGCVTTPKPEATVTGSVGSAEGQWHGKALVRNLKTGKNAVLDLDLLAREPSQLRMEITGSFGVRVASIALNGEEVRYVLPQEKRFVQGPADADALAKLVPVRIPPRALLAVLFERELPEKDWKCDREAATHLPIFCSFRDGRVAVKWIDRNGRNRRVKILAPEAEIEMVLDEAKSKVEMGPDAFVLKAPEGYKQERTTAG